MVLRIQKAEKLLREIEVDLLVVEDPIDLFYLTGLHLSEGRMIIEEGKSALFVDGRYFEACKESFSEVFLNSGYGASSVFGKDLIKRSKARVGFDALKTTYQSYEFLSEIASNKFQLAPLKAPLKRVREVKEESEIALLREAAILGSRGFDFVLTLLKEGVRERDVASELDIFWKKNGGDRVSFEPIIAFGRNSAFPHYRAGDAVLKRNEPILIDIGVMKGFYASDMTRVVALGKLDERLEKVYQIVNEAKNRALKIAKAGVKIKELDKMARDTIKEAGYENYFPHGLGHGVGLEVHELPIVKADPPYGEVVLKANMVITIEPGIYLPGLGGVRLEDSIVIKENGYENLTSRPCTPYFETSLITKLNETTK